MQIYGFQKTTLLDFPGKVACTIFTGGCNFRCPFCHNGDLVLIPDQMTPIPEEDVFSYLARRNGVLDGVCISGGEPALQPDLIDFIKRVRSLGLSVKLDTNGYRPDLIVELVTAGLIDYVAMDIKQCPEKYNFISQVPDFDLRRIKDSVSFLIEGNVPYEFRTTVVRELHDKHDFERIGTWLRGDSPYFLQPYKDSDQVLLSDFTSYSYPELKDFKDTLLPLMPNTAIRGMDAISLS